MTCLDECRKRSTSRCDIGQSHLLLGHLKPQKEIEDSPPVVLVKVARKKAGIDVSCHKALSCRSETSSK